MRSKAVFCAASILIVTAVGADMATAQRSTTELKDEKARLELERDVLNLEVEVLTARGQITAIQSPAAQTPAQAAAEAKAKYDALIAQYNAQKAAAEAEAAADKTALQTAIGTVPTSGVTGAVNVKTDAGKGEATLLSATAVSQAAARIGATVSPAIGNSRVLIYTGSDRPRFQHWRSFKMRQGLILKGIEAAREIHNAATAADAELPAAIKAGVTPGTTEAPPMAVAGAVLEGLKNLGSFFQTEYEIGGISVSPDDSLLSAAVIRHLRAKHKKVMDPSRYLPSTGDDQVLTYLTAVETQLRTAPQIVASSETRAKQLREKAGAKGTPDASKDQLNNVAAMYERAAAAWKAAIESYATLLKDLATPDSGGTLLAFKVADEQFLFDRMAKGDMALFLKVNSAVGGYYTKKNVWTFLGGMPFYTMGGAVVTFALVDGKEGMVLASGELPVHSGYAKANAVHRLVQPSRVLADRPTAPADSREDE
jgi:hypothetical protein